MEVLLWILGRGLGKHPQEKSPLISINNLLSSAIYCTIVATSSLVAVEALPDEVVVLPDASGIVLM